MPDVFDMFGAGWKSPQVGLGRMTLTENLLGRKGKYQLLFLNTNAGRGRELKCVKCEVKMIIYVMRDVQI